MLPLLLKIWDDDAGALISLEFLFVATILVLGMSVGLTSLRQAINTELIELANAILALSGQPPLPLPVLTPPPNPSNIDVDACSP